MEAEKKLKTNFIEWFKEEFSNVIKSFDEIPEKYDDQIDEYKMVLMEEIDKNQFMNANFKKLNEKCDFETPLTIWVYGAGDNESSSSFSYNWEYDSYYELLGNDI